MTDENWRLDQDSELNVLIPWLAAHPETETPVKNCVAQVLNNPYNRGGLQEYTEPAPGDPPMLWAAVRGGTELGVLYILNETDKTVVLVDIGRGSPQP